MHTSGTPVTPCKSFTTAESLVTHPAWRPKKVSVIEVSLRESNQGRFRKQALVYKQSVGHLRYSDSRTRWVVLWNSENVNVFKPQITTFAEYEKIQLTPKTTNNLFTCYLNCMCNSNPICLIQHCSVIFFVGVLCAMILFSGLGIRKLTHWLVHIHVHSEKVCSSVLHFIKWMTRFLYYDFERFACARIPTQIQINITIQI